MIANNTPNTVEIKLEKIKALDAGLPSAIAPINAISQITRIITGKNKLSVALLFMNWKMLNRSAVSFASGVG